MRTEYTVSNIRHLFTLSIRALCPFYSNFPTNFVSALNTRYCVQTRVLFDSKLNLFDSNKSTIVIQDQRDGTRKLAAFVARITNALCASYLIWIDKRSRDEKKESYM